MTALTHATHRRAAPTGQADRITNLDAIRGFAVLGILAMNAVSFGLPEEAYLNLDAGGSETWLDWVIGGMGEIFFDQKMMGLFSLLFGASIVLFADRAAAKGKRAALLSLWRNSLLLGMGVIHTLFWEGDVLLVYAICAPVLIWLRNWPPRVLLATGVVIVLLSAVYAMFLEIRVPAYERGFVLLDGEVAVPEEDEVEELFELFDPVARALGMMLIGVALYRFGILQGRRSSSFYRKLAKRGLLIGLVLAAASLVIQAVNDFSPDIVYASLVPNTIGTIPATLGYVGLITLWNQRVLMGFRMRIHAVGRMALTNYLTQTMLGLFVLGYLLDDWELTRTDIFLFVLGVWALQVAWSKPWLDRFNYGPFEWLWRVLTYRSWQPFRHVARSA